jgi:hypothetical protein
MHFTNKEISVQASKRGSSRNKNRWTEEAEEQTDKQTKARRQNKLKIIKYKANFTVRQR